VFPHPGTELALFPVEVFIVSFGIKAINSIAKRGEGRVSVGSTTKSRPGIFLPGNSLSSSWRAASSSRKVNGPIAEDLAAALKLVVIKHKFTVIGQKLSSQPELMPCPDHLKSAAARRVHIGMENYGKTDRRRGSAAA
jgi:hypothetical protein